MVKKLTLEEEVEMLRNYLKKLSVDELREAISRNYVDYNTFENEIYEESIYLGADINQKYSMNNKLNNIENETLNRFDVIEGDIKVCMTLKAS